MEKRGAVTHLGTLKTGTKNNPPNDASDVIHAASIAPTKQPRRIRSVKANSRPRAAGKASESEIHRRCYRAAMPEPNHLAADDACLAPFGDLLKKFGFGSQGDGTPFAGNGVGATIAELLRETWAH